MLVLSADLTSSCEADLFRDTYPERFVTMGMAEQNLIGVAAGLACEHKEWCGIRKTARLTGVSPEDDAKGDQWDHTALDVDSRLVVSLVVGKRNGEALKEVVSDFADRTGGAPPS